MLRNILQPVAEELAIEMGPELAEPVLASGQG